MPNFGTRGRAVEERDAPPASKRRRWAWLLKHVFAEDLENCQKCGGVMRWAEVAKTPGAALRLMARVGLSGQPPPVARRAALGQMAFEF